jgi:hypothetical protein
MPQQPRTKHEIATNFFKLVAFQPASNWQSSLLLNTAHSVEDFQENSNLSSSKFFIPDNFYRPEECGPLNLLKSSIDDPFGIIQTIKTRKAKSRFCEKLTYEGFEIFIFVEDRKLVSLIIDPHQFLNAFNAEIITRKMNRIDLDNLGIGWSSKDQHSKEHSWIDWSLKEKEERIRQIIESYKTNNLSHHWLFKTINELWENHSEIDNREEFLFDLLPTILILFDIAGLNRTNYLKNSKLVEGNELFDFNKFCLSSKDYADKSGGLFKTKREYKYFKQSVFFIDLIATSSKNRVILIKNFLKKTVKRVSDKRNKKIEACGFTPQAEIEFIEKILTDKKDIFKDMIERKVLIFYFCKVKIDEEVLNKISKIALNVDQLYLFIKDNVESSEQLPISSYFFHLSHIIKFLSPLILNFTEEFAILELLVTLNYIDGCIRGQDFLHQLLETLHYIGRLIYGVQHPYSTWDELQMFAGFALRPDPSSWYHHAQVIPSCLKSIDKLEDFQTLKNTRIRKVAP